MDTSLSRINSSACEQINSWIKSYAHMLSNMNEYRFASILLLLFHLRNCSHTRLNPTWTNVKQLLVSNTFRIFFHVGILLFHPHQMNKAKQLLTEESSIIKHTVEKNETTEVLPGEYRQNNRILEISNDSQLTDELMSDEDS